MNWMRSRYVILAAVASLLILVAPVGAANQEKEYEEFDSDNFDRSTTIDNESRITQALEGGQNSYQFRESEA